MSSYTANNSTGEIPYSIILSHHGEKVMVDNDVADFLVNKTVYVLSGYPGVRVGRVVKPLHRVIMDAPKGVEVDHINRDKLDCRRQNLRFCTRAENKHNRGPNRGMKFKGISKHKRKSCKKPWQAMIRVGDTRHFLGMFATEIEAARAYNEAAKKYYGNFAWLNPV